MQQALNKTIVQRAQLQRLVAEMHAEMHRMAAQSQVGAASPSKQQVRAGRVHGGLRAAGEGRQGLWGRGRGGRQGLGRLCFQLVKGAEADQANSHSVLAASEQIRILPSVALTLLLCLLYRSAGLQVPQVPQRPHRACMGAAMTPLPLPNAPLAHPYPQSRPTPQPLGF